MSTPSQRHRWMTHHTGSPPEPADLFSIEIHDEIARFLDGLPEREYDRLDQAAGELAELGPGLGMPRSRPLGDGLFELRAQLFNNTVACRLTYWFPPGPDRRAVLLTQFRKTRDNERGEVQRAYDARKECDAEHTGIVSRAYRRP